MVTATPETPALDTPDRRGVTYASKLLAADVEHIRRVAEIIRDGGIVAFPFNGVFGLFGDVDNLHAVEAIIEAKGRPRDRKFIVVSTPETIDQHTDLDRTSHSKDNLVALWKGVHALGIILPASTRAPYHLTIGEGLERTILTIWTEYPPLRSVVENFHSLGGRSLIGTSANKSGEPTHFDPDNLYLDFNTNVQAVVYDRFDHLPPQRKKSTTIIDLTNRSPRLYREGNVSEDELRQALRKYGFPELVVGRDVITVRSRTH